MMQPSIKPADEHSAGDIIARIGSLTRMLRDSLRELGLDQAIAEAAEAIPDARDRLYYVVQMTAQAAERALMKIPAREASCLNRSISFSVQKNIKQKQGDLS